jgi:hypothetical protein
MRKFFLNFGTEDKNTIMPFKRLAALFLTVFAIMAAPARAQQNAPQIGYVYPAGGRHGDTIEVEVGGQFLDSISDVHVSGNGIQAKVLDLAKPLPPAETTTLREKLQELQKKEKDPATQKEIEEIRQKLAVSMNRNSNPAISNRARIQIILSSDAEPGKRELRLRTPLGWSNPLVFCVGNLPEYREKNPKMSAEDTATDVSLPAVLNGQLIPGSVGRYRTLIRQQQAYLPGDADRYRFSARKGQRLVASVSARELNPYLPDTVPGWLQAVLALYDSAGNEAAYNDDFFFHPDPVLYYEIPKDGTYTIEIRDALYRGRDDFVYRIEIGELPFLTGIFPMGGRAGTRVQVETLGWNLPGGKQLMDAGKMAPGIHSFSTSIDGLESNKMPFMVDDLPECLEKEPNDSPRKSQIITIPIIVNGRIGQPGDRDVFRFKGRAGDRIVSEVYARRLNSPLDSVIKLTDDKGNQLALNDDFEDKESGFETHHADSYISETLPADGTYYLTLWDAQNRGGPEYGYRLRIGAPRPDFDLRIAPSAMNALVGPNVPITVYAFRKDGFSGEIALSLKDAPKGWALRDGVVPADQDKVQTTLTIPAAAAKETISFILEGRAVVGGHEIVRLATPVDDRMQAFIYRHLVPAKESFVSTTGRGPNQEGLRILNELPLQIPSGGKLRVQMTMPVLRSLEKIQFELSEPPEGISIADSLVTTQGAEFFLQSDAAKAKPGLKGNMIVKVSGERTPTASANDKPAPARRQRLPLGTLPAIPFEIIKP